MKQCFFFFNDTATTEIYTLSLHDALPICARQGAGGAVAPHAARLRRGGARGDREPVRAARAHGARVPRPGDVGALRARQGGDRKSTRLNSSHANISYAVFCLKKKNRCPMT